MSQERTIEIEDLKRVCLDPGDTLLVRISPSWKIPDETIAKIKRILGDAFPDNEVLVLTLDAELAIVRPYKAPTEVRHAVA